MFRSEARARLVWSGHSCPLPLTFMPPVTTLHAPLQQLNHKNALHMRCTCSRVCSIEPELSIT
jgi:hypothetical protein